jgi:hypothetical protein
MQIAKKSGQLSRRRHGKQPWNISNCMRTLVRPRAGFAAAVLLVATAATAAPLRPLVTVDVTREPDPIELDVAANTNGGFLVAWRAGNNNGAVAPVRARLFDSQGHPRSSLLTIGGAGGSGVDVVPSINGSYWVVYATALDAIVARRVTRHGTLEGRPITLLPPPKLLLAFRADGNPFDGGLVVWTQTFDGVNHQTLRVFDSTGAPRGPAWEDFGGDKGAQLAMGSDGSSLLVAESIGSDGFGGHLYDLYARRFDRDGALIGSPMTVTPSLQEGTWGYDFAVTPSGMGDFLFTWLEQRDGGAATELQRLTADGTLTGVRDAGHQPSGSPTAPALDGGFVLAWNHGAVDLAHPQLAVQGHALDGSPTSDPLVLDGGNAISPWSRVALAADGTGSYVAAWWRAEAGVRTPVLRAVRFRFDGRN